MDPKVLEIRASWNSGVRGLEFRVNGLGQGLKVLFGGISSQVRAKTYGARLGLEIVKITPKSAVAQRGKQEYAGLNLLLLPVNIRRLRLLLP